MGRIRHKVVTGKTCASCGRNQRFAKDRRCVFCANWAAWDNRTLQSQLLRWDLAHDYRARERSRVARASRRAVKGSTSASDARHLLEWQDGCCVYCDETRNLHFDHVVPVSRGGTGYWWNMQWLCARHNLEKGARTDAEYRAEFGITHIHVPKWSILLSAAVLFV